MLRAELRERGKVSNDGIICTLATTHYPIDSTLGSSQKQMMAASFAFKTGTGFKIIRKSVLPTEWEFEVDEKARPPSLIDANGRPLSLGQSAWLTVRFAKPLY